jgi:CubicO group peptidase (beta-lactamase class C family)
MVNKFTSNLLGLLIIALVTNAAVANSEADLKESLEKTIEAEKLAGIVWSTVSNDASKVGSAGFANTSMDTAMSGSQKMHVGSVTKTVLAVGVLRLITEGKLSLNTDVEALLTDLIFQNAWQNSAPIRVKNLLEHTAGLDNIRMWQFLNTAPTPDTPLQNAFPQSNSELLTVRTEPGTQYSYSNMGYTLLAMVVEAVSGERYESYLDRNFLQPLGMFDSTFTFVSQTGDSADAALAMGYFENDVSQSAVPIYLRPAGQFTTTAPDMAKFMRFILDDGIINGEPFVRLDLMKKLGYPDGTDAEKAGLKIGHGLALAVRDRHDVVGMCHPGTTIGFRAYICLFPDEGKGFFYAINTDNETSDYEIVNSIFIDNLRIEKASIVDVDNRNMDAPLFEGVYLPSPNNMAEFQFLDLVFNSRWINRQENEFLMRSLQTDDRVLLQLNDKLFRAGDRTQASHAIIANENGDIFISDGLSTYQKSSALIIIGYWLSLILGLLGMIYLVAAGGLRIAAQGRKGSQIIFWPFLNILAFSIPVIFYLNQSFLSFGELTAASLSLAVVSGLLPLTLLIALLLVFRQGFQTKWARLDCLASVASLQLCAVLFFWGVVPLIFWQ